MQHDLHFARIPHIAWALCNHHPPIIPPILTPTHPAFPCPTPTSISYLSFHPALFVDKPRGHWPAHMVTMWHFSNSLMARLEAPMYVCVSVCVIGGWSEKRSDYCSFFVLRNHDPHPKALRLACRLTQSPLACLIAMLTPQTTLVHIVPGLNPIVCDNVPSHQSIWHRTLWKRAAAAGCIYHRLIWPFNLTRHIAHAPTKQVKKLNKASNVVQRQQMM